MDFALLESGTAARASHKIDRAPNWSIRSFAVYEKRHFLWAIPYWHPLKTGDVRAELEAWLHENWKVPAYFHITRKVPA